MIDVPCLTFDSLVSKHGVTAVDLVQMDTEGYDFEIVKLIDLDRLRPRLIMYEAPPFRRPDRAALFRTPRPPRAMNSFRMWST